MPSDLYNIARQYVGTPFYHRGRQPGHRLDCSGVVVCALREMGERVQDTTEYGRVGIGSALQDAVAFHCDRIEEVEPGAIGVFFYDQRYVAQHCGVFGPSSLVHSWADAGRVMEHAWPDSFWEKRLIAIYRFRHKGC